MIACRFRSLAFFVVLGSVVAIDACSLDTEGTLSNAAGGGGAGASATGGSGGQGATTSGSGGTTSGSGGSTSGSGGSGGDPCVPAAEDCLNGVDDDCDLLADCEDSDSCGGYTCIEVPAGGTLVEPVANSGDCTGALVELGRSDCSACNCSPNDNGTCAYVATLYTTSDCQGAPNETILIPAGEGCTNSPATTAESGDTVGAVGEAVGQGDADCQPDSLTPAVTPRYLCALAAPGFCQSGHACALTGSVSCVLFDGDVDCPSPFDNKELVFDTTAGLCDCTCSTESQTCQAGDHFHAEATNACDDQKFDVAYGTGCNDTGLGVVRGARDHGPDAVATGATCTGGGTAKAAPTQSLCCPP